MSEGSGKKVVVVGAGARDHALCYALANSAQVSEIHAVPGNAGIQPIAECHTDLELSNHNGIVNRVIELAPDFVIVGPEDLLVAGLASEIQDRNILCLGPTKAAAQIEGSKLFAKSLMDKVGVPTPAWRSCSSVEEAYAAVEEFNGRVAVKADGLAMGCGVFVCKDKDEAFKAIDTLLVQKLFGDSCERILIEELVQGEEVSLMVLVDGANVLPLPAARDYKKLSDYDDGPNTGGMGAFSPSFELDDYEVEQIISSCVQPIVDELKKQGSEFRGVLYVGLMLTKSGVTVLEYNCRFGNPETQALVRVIDRDFLELVECAALGNLSELKQVEAKGSAVAVCIAAANYPEKQLEDSPVLVSGLDKASAVTGVEIFYNLGSSLNEQDGTYYADGGRVVTVSAWGETLELATDRAYQSAELINLDGKQLRSDIGSLQLVY